MQMTCRITYSDSLLFSDSFFSSCPPKKRSFRSDNFAFYVLNFEAPVLSPFFTFTTLRSLDYFGPLVSGAGR